jgi:phosphodiesterase/alkaline phosphatase D-like protein
MSTLQLIILLFAQLLPLAKKPARVEIKQGPALELAHDDVAVVRWTTNNPGGADHHFGVVYYGTNRKDLSLVARSRIRLNRGHPETTFRVRLDGLAPQTTYYYRVTSIESTGRSDGVRSTIRSFTTPALGERLLNPLPAPPTTLPSKRG